MPRPATITYELVSAAADAFLAREGRDPTLIEVRAELGNTGSMSTISEHMRTWKAQRQERPAPPPVELPATLAAGLTDFGRRVWTEATGMADERVRAAEARIEEERTAIAAEREQLGAALRLVEEERDQAGERLAEMEKAREADRMAAEAELVDARARLDATTGELHQLQAAEREATRRAELAEERGRGLDAIAAEREQHVADLRLERDQLRGERDQAQAEAAKLRTDLEASASLLSDAQAENASLLTDRDGLRERLEAAERQAQVEADRRVAIEERDHQTRDDLVAAREEIARLEERLAVREPKVLPKPVVAG